MLGWCHGPFKGTKEHEDVTRDLAGNLKSYLYSSVLFIYLYQLTLVDSCNSPQWGALNTLV